MRVLVLGHRRGLQLALERMGVSYAIWNLSPVKNKSQCQEIVVAPFPESVDELKSKLSNSQLVTHVIAGSEEAVFPASKIRLWLNTRRNPLGIVVKCTDKLAMKRYLFKMDIPMTPFLGGDEISEPSEIIKKLGEPVIVKPRRSSGGRGLKKIFSTEQLVPELGDDKILEACIFGNEGSVESLVQSGNIIFTNITEYYKLGHCNLVPSHLNQGWQKKILDLNQKVIKSLNIQWGMTHLEFYRKGEELLFGEIALRPPGGYIMEALGWSYDSNFWDFFVKLELDHKLPTKIQRKMFSSSVVFHPEPGIVQGIVKQEEAKSLSSVKKWSLKVALGDEVKTRSGVGQDCGYAILAHPDFDLLMKDVHFLLNDFQIKTSVQN
jgi:predicted ATP-grasp superfamily ATP-dependent carboligase